MYQNEIYNFCRPVKIDKYGECIKKYNKLDVKVDEEFVPRISDDLIYRTTEHKVRVFGSKIGDILYKYKNSKSKKEDLLLNGLKNMDFNHISSDINLENDENKYFKDNIFTLLSREYPDMQLCDGMTVSNDVLYVVYVLSPDYKSLKRDPKLMHVMLVLGSNTLDDFTNKIKCPLCLICSSVLNEFLGVRKFIYYSSEEHDIFDIGNNFKKSFGDIVHELNNRYKYTSRSGCTHDIIVIAGYLINIHDKSNFPTIIGGSFSNPPLCHFCDKKYGVYFIKNDNGVNFSCEHCSDRVEGEKVYIGESLFEYNE